ncbi:MAG: FAD:protein FMN transferase [Pyrinomonadaceae bacterium]|nr:FAD:protein FMN transferase [Phycisphaerales bacterium]
MNTRFEFVVIGDDESHLRGATEEAIAEIESCEDRLSLFRPGSLLSRINRRASMEPVGVDRETFELLAAAKRLSAMTEGAFDPTVAPLMKVWNLHDSASSAADAPSLEAARQCVGVHLVELDPDRLTVRFTKDGVSLDLGGIAKGHALGLAEGVLRRAAVDAALIHAGASSVTAIGAPPGTDGWKIGLAGMPRDDESESSDGSRQESEPHGANPQGAASFTDGPGAFVCPPRRLAPLGSDGADHSIVFLKDQSLSVSAPHGRETTVDGQRVTHILDPRTGRPAPAVRIAAAIADDPTVAEAISTALIVLGRRPRHLPLAYVTILPADSQAYPFCTEPFNAV